MNLLNGDNVFHRDLNKTYPIITHGEGIYLYDKTGKRYIDASSGAVAANLGHSNERIAQAMAEQASKVGFVHTLRFETEVLHELATGIAKLAPSSLNKVYFTSGGSEANESAIKLARQYHYDRGNKDKHIVIGRLKSYHGNTIGSLSAGGDLKRREPFKKMLLPFRHVNPPSSDTKMDYIEELEKTIKEIGPEFISSFICEPIVGSQQGAMVPPEGYLLEIKNICKAYDIVFIVDEVMTGFGRTGKNFAIEHFDVEPDIITFGKGVSAGYAPLGGMIAHDKIIDSIMEFSDGQFVHGYTYSGHPVSVAAGLATLKYYNENKILEKVRKQSDYLFSELEKVKMKHSIIEEVRGKGLLVGVELVSNRIQQIVNDENKISSYRLNEIAMDLGAVFYPGKSIDNGKEKHHLLIAPPLNITSKGIDEIIEILIQALNLHEKEID